MESSSGNAVSDEGDVAVHLPHHIQHDLCTSRAAYRQGRKLTAVKVYTVSNESQNLIVYRVPAINLGDELYSLCAKAGSVTSVNKLELTDPGEEFTDIYHVHYSKIRDARRAKRFLDGRSFYGSLLHVCYAPEMESVEETRLKLVNRRNEIAYLTGRRMKVPNMSLKRPMKSFVHNSNGPPPLKIAKIHTEPTPGPSYVPVSISAPFIQNCSPPVPTQSQEASHSNEQIVPGPYDHNPAYPSQQVLQLPGNEVKVARQKKFTPSSVIRRIPNQPAPNRIIFHKKNA